MGFYLLIFLFLFLHELVTRWATFKMFFSIYNSFTVWC